ncbi:MAG: rod shape-determining protein MreC, partial [Thermodesulfobacteriota bacterium]
MLVGRVVSFVATPVQSAITGMAQGVSTTWSGYIYLVGIKEENDKLKERVALLENENARLLEEVESARRVKELLGFKEKQSLPMVAAEIIGTDTYGWTKTFSIDRGGEDGVERNMAVVTHRGIVGKIIEVHGDTSKVLL